MEYCTIRNNSIYGIRTNSDYSGGDGSVLITDSHIHDNGGRGIYAENSNLGIQYNEIEHNDGDGVYIYNATVGNPTISGSGYFKSNNIHDNASNAVEVSYNGTLYDGYTSTEGNNQLVNNESHEIYLSSSSARWYQATGGSYTAVGETINKFVYNIAQDGGSDWEAVMENNAWNYSTPSASDFFGEVDYNPYQTSQMFGSVGPRNSGPPALTLSTSSKLQLTPFNTNHTSKEGLQKISRKILALIQEINNNRESADIHLKLNGLMGYFNQLPDNKKSEFGVVISLLNEFIFPIPSTNQINTNLKNLSLVNEMALMLKINQQLLDGNPRQALSNSREYESSFKNLDIQREMGFIKANALKQLNDYKEAIVAYQNLSEISRKGYDPENTNTDYEDHIRNLEEIIEEKSEGFEKNTTKVENQTSFKKDSEIPATFDLKAAYPNPFNPTTNISFDLPEAGHVQIEVYNINGQLVASLTNQRYQPGIHILQFDAGQLSSGIYLVKANLAGNLFSQKITMIK